MNTNKPWVALLDEDEDDHVFWRYGFETWATHLDLRWFTTVHAFVTAAALGKSNPTALVMGSVVPRGEEVQWLSTMLLHPSCQQACLPMLSDDMREQKHRTYMDLGATDHLVKPVTTDELKASVFKVSEHIAAQGCRILSH
ncbi:MAG: hypothetical protein EOO61_09620 [Hymenobacter sp.]|nr:MAG: hypothetical protein EOO61_09620 [Hymenobacter sp.]